jgi:hypothetical protein
MIKANYWKKVLVLVLLVSFVSNLAGAETFRFTASVDNRPVQPENIPRWEWLLDQITANVGDEGVFHIMPGDIDPPWTTDASLKTQFGPDVVWYPVVGNHEAETPEDMTWIREAFSSLPYVVNSGPSGCGTTTYSFDYGNAHFVAINEYYDGTSDTGTDGDVVDALYNWLVDDLANNTKPAVFVIGHEPAYPEYAHVGDSLDGHPANRDRFWKLLNDEKVIAYLCGHTHWYYAKQVDGDDWEPFTWQIDCGNAGNPREAAQTFVDVTVTNTDVTFTAWQGTQGNPYTIRESWTVDIPEVAVAHSPSPADGQTGVGINPTLTWEAPTTGADSYDVYFGAGYPPASIDNQTATSYDHPETLALNTTYYWRIDSVIDGTTYTGNDWIFTTADVPGQASSPDPDGTTLVAVDADLSWTAGSETTMHQIYFAGEPVVEQSLGNETYDPGQLLPDTVYSWRIDEVGPGGTTTGDVWSFTTAAAPDQVASGSPTNSETDVDITTDLNWTAATGADSYDVYFGDSYPPASIGNQAGITYDPGTLDPDTIYYWQIDSVGPGGTTTGAELNFTTAAAPGEAYDPQPPDGTQAVLLETDLSWSDGSGATAHDVYFGVEPQTLVLVSEGQTATTFDPGMLDSGTTYYWAIDEVGPGGVTPGPIWTFTTVALPWTDGFESGDLITGGWVTSGLVTITDDAFTGSHAVRTNRPASLEKAISTAGFGSITVSFVAKTFGMDEGDYLYVEWFDGSGWVEEGTVDRTVSDWAGQTFNCLGAEDNSNFIIKFRSNAEKNREYVFIDDVQISGIPLAPDTTPPTPSKMTWAIVPYATGENSISMTATIASDPSGVEYYFTCTAGGGNHSGWQDSPTYEDTVLTPETPYTYTVKARDKSVNLNETVASDPASATTDAVDTTAPAPDPMTWATVPYATGSTSVSMTATTASDPSGVEYYFACIAGGGNDSGWQDSATYEDTGLSPNIEYTYTVQARDKSPSQNTTTDVLSSEASATTPDAPVTDMVTIVRADYRIRQKVFTVQATSSQGGVAVLTVVGYGTMTYNAEENLYTFRETVATVPDDTVTVESDLGGSDTASVTHK